MAIELPPLPFAPDALESKGLSKETIDYHYGKHHAAYVNQLNGLIEGTENADKSLEEIILAADAGPLFNNSAQVWNHTFYWNCLSPTGGGAPTGELGDAINSAFGSFDAFSTEFSDAAKTQFGSGWAWLVKSGDKLEIVKTANAETPLTTDKKPLLTIDVWEHAYYVDFRNARPKYIDTFLDSLVNWDFANANLAG